MASVGAAGAGALELLVALVHLVLGGGAEGLDPVAPVEGGADLFVGLHEALQLAVEVLVLVLEHVAVVLQRVDLLAQVAVAPLQALVREAQVVLLAARHREVLLGAAQLGLQPVQLPGQLPVAGQLGLRALHEVGLLAHFEVEGARELALVVVEAGELVAGGLQVAAGGLVGLLGAAQVELAEVGDLGEFGGALLQLEQVVVGGLDALVRLAVLALLERVQVAQPVDFELVPRPLLLQLLQLVRRRLVVLAQLVREVALLLHVALRSENFGLAPRDLLPQSADLALAVVVRPVLFVEEEAGVFGFLLEALEADEVAVVAGLEVVVLQQLLVLQVAVLRLDGVQLVAQRKVVLVPLLDLKNLRLQLRDQQVLLVRGQVHRVVVLHEPRGPMVSK